MDDKGGMEKCRSKRERRFAVASYKNQKKTNMACRFGVAWQRVNRFDDARDSHFSCSVPFAPKHPATGLRLFSQEPANNAGRCCT